MNPEHAPLRKHEFDGICEYDNPTPGWWHALFIASIIFSFFYYVYYEGNRDAATIWSQLDAAQAEETKRIFGAMGELQPDAATLIMLMGDDKMMKVGAGMYQSACAACHAKDGGGINGVNLTDHHYKNATSIEDLFRVITEGAGSGAMPAWRNNYSQNERVLLASYIASLRGTSPATPRHAEGEVIPPWPTGGK